MVPLLTERVGRALGGRPGGHGVLERLAPGGPRGGGPVPSGLAARDGPMTAARGLRRGRRRRPARGGPGPAGRAPPTRPRLTSVAVGPEGGLGRRRAGPRAGRRSGWPTRCCGPRRPPWWPGPCWGRCATARWPRGHRRSGRGATAGGRWPRGVAGRRSRRRAGPQKWESLTDGPEHPLAEHQGGRRPPGGDAAEPLPVHRRGGSRGI